MEKEDLISFLRENLSVFVELSQRTEIYNDNKASVKATVTLRLGDEEISKSSDYVTLEGL
jgi:hypothetical protein